MPKIRVEIEVPRDCRDCEKHKDKVLNIKNCKENKK